LGEAVDSSEAGDGAGSSDEAGSGSGT
jgi:hypothetical protein